MAGIERDDAPREKCGVVGVFTPTENAARVAFFALFALQHRGQESAGISVWRDPEIHGIKRLGLVTQIFDEAAITALESDRAIGHTRYSTTGQNVHRNAQPIMCHVREGQLALAHNGNLTNTVRLRQSVLSNGDRPRSTSDSELMAMVMVRALKNGVEAAVREVFARCEGAFSVTALTPDCLIGFRDPYGLRPLTLGRLEDGGWLLASETCAFPPVGGTPEREIQPGEAVIIDENGPRFIQVVEPRRVSMCLFEFIYFARPDSRMYGTALYSARQRMGMQLAREHPAPDGADIIVPVPDSGIPAARGFSLVSGIPVADGMMKNRYIQRTFIQPDQRLRDLGVRMKLSPLEENLDGKKVVLVDDSIVRGTTTLQIVRLLKDSGAKEVHVRITAPPIVWPCYYGIDMATREQLFAYKKQTDEERCKALMADSLGYLSLEGAMDAVGEGDRRFCTACFSGDYPIPFVAEEQLRDLSGDPTDLDTTFTYDQGSLFD